jgi:hypothetical protein
VTGHGAVLDRPAILARGLGDDPLAPREAASLLQETQREARHQFTQETPPLSSANALTVLVIYGAIWSTSRGHHPYRGPSLGVIGVVYIVVAVIIVVSVTMYLRAKAGISGPSRREERITTIPPATSAPTRPSTATLSRRRCR